MPVAILDALIEVARRYGRDPEFSRGGGGNASVKVDGVLYIKPSGVALATLTAADLVPLDLAPLLALLQGGDRGPEDAPAESTETTGGVEAGPLMRAAMAARLADTGGRRPSVELLFHAFLPEQFVLHTHPVAMNAITCNRDGATIARRLYGDRALWVSYTDPGLPLARAIVEARRARMQGTGRPAPAVTLMQNHGIIVGGNSPSEIDQQSGWLVEAVRAAIQSAVPPAESGGAGPAPVGIDEARAQALVDVVASTLRGLLASDEVRRAIIFDDAPLAAAFTATPAGRSVVLGGPLTPDQIVYTGSWPLLLDLPVDVHPDDASAVLQECLAVHVAAHGTPPIIVVVPRLGLFAAGDTWEQADTARHVYLDSLRVAEGALALGGVRALSNAERTFIEIWEAEAYRRGVAAAR